VGRPVGTRGHGPLNSCREGPVGWSVGLSEREAIVLRSKEWKWRERDREREREREREKERKREREEELGWSFSDAWL
jgi:hypothetical protein